jgi:hypothetical protein
MRIGSVTLLGLMTSLLLTATEQASGATPTTGAAVAADIETTQTTHPVDGNTLTRTVSADPVSRTAVILDLARRVATRITFTPITEKGTRRAAVSSDTPGRQVMELRTKVIEGVQVVGKKFVFTIPPGSTLGNARPIQRVSEVWTAETLKLPMLVTVSDPLGRTTITAYKNIKTNWMPDEQLFEIPPGFEVREENPRTN